jgi:hypothetical protein
MQALSVYKRRAASLVVPGFLRGFPDVDARSPNDPVYMLSSADTFKLITQFSDVVDRNELTLGHYLVLWAYALNNGWREVYLDGGQLFLSSGLRPKNAVVEPCVVRTTIVEVDTSTHPNKANIIDDYVGKHDPQINAVGVTLAGVRQVVYIDADGVEHQMDADITDVLRLRVGDFYVGVVQQTGDIEYKNPPSTTLSFKVEYALIYG